MSLNPISRRRIWITVAAVLVIAAGLASRSNSIPLPGLVKTYAGDTLWAVLVFLLLAFVRPRATVLWTAGGALSIAFGVELLQLYHAPWLDSFRETLPGRLVLGRGFLFSDLICYTIGVSIAALVFQYTAERHMRSFKTIACAASIVFLIVAVIAANAGEVSQIFWFANKVPGKDKTGHFLIMGGLAFFAVLAIAPRLKASPAKASAITMLCLSVPIALEEFSQKFFSYRSFSVADLVCSLAGVLVFGTLAFLIVRRAATSPR